MAEIVFKSTLLLSICIAVLHLTQGMDPEFLKEMLAKVDECKGKHNVSQEDAMKIINMKKVITEENEKCFTGCLLESMGFVKNTIYLWEEHVGVLDKALDDEVKREKLTQVLKTCNSVNEKEHENICQLGYEITLCIRTEAKKAGIFPPENEPQGQ